jgi:HPt (histidine-containing phosphotransfer) domain-containing protein
MKNAYRKKDFALIEKIAHKVKGGAVYVGTTRMKYACQYLERYWKTGQQELFDKLYQQTIHTIKDTSVYISNWLKKPYNSEDR